MGDVTLVPNHDNLDIPAFRRYMCKIIEATKQMESLNSMDMVVVGLALIIGAAALFMLISGVWAARDK
ncbi:hypothetical protein IQ266_13805 [filamentous cyanobacterium LEGE 11480]|uniref:Uncharacterized protein n=1 Tax=Romeriopsis navalis LEGE 11480 TaxID=2777977 RepID=A0A928VND9_9CYAN|nr:hypothetical protein [Romeriopsis navalis]MBE9030807.1 hypothetical protein [Romeriopsis navalis LEGE 11480]